MSALAGIIHFDQHHSVDRATAERLLSLLTPYGRDAQNSWERGGALLMRSLLRTTPEDRIDRQPVQSSRTGRVTIFDGRIDNRKELTEALGLESPRLRFMADSELVSMALDAWQECALDKLRGDFGLAQWDPNSRRLLLARDAVGHRPVFWHAGDGFFAFGSLPKVLWAIPQVPRQLREDALHDYLCLMPMDSQATLFQSIHRLEAGQYLILENGRFKIDRYHRFGQLPVIELNDPREYVEALAEKIERAVAPRLRAIGPVASELSSGFDSSTVTAMAALQLQRSGQRLMAFTGVLPPEQRDGPVPRGYHRDEGPGAQALAAMYDNVDHFLIESAGRSPLNRLAELIESADRPVLNPCNANWVQDVQEAVVTQGGRVLLNGWQGNLTISYDGRCLLHSLLLRGRWIQWLRVVRALSRRYPKQSKAGRWFVKFSIAPLIPAILWAAYRRARGSGISLSEYSAVSSSLQAQYETEKRARQRNHDVSYRGDLNGIRYRIAPLYRVEFAETCLSMNAAGLDPRSPLMDRDLIEFCLQVPEGIYLRNGQPQWLIRELGKKLLPDKILNARTRGYQGADWFDSASSAREQLRTELELFRRHESIGRYLDLEEMERLLDDWPESGWHRPGVETRYRNKLLRAFSVGTFVRYIENDNRH